MQSISKQVLRAASLTKQFLAVGDIQTPVTIFRDLALFVAASEMVAIVGESGAGKSTLLHILAAMDAPSAGEVWCDTTHVTALNPDAASTWRNREIGYVWQAHHLLPEFTAEENVALPLMSRGVARAEALSTARTWLTRVGLADRALHRSGELSGGEQQRVAIARALVTQPKVLLADEPTGNLDAATAEHVFTLLRTLQQEQQLAAVIVTHNMEFAARCDRILRLKDGRLA